ncbi:MAG: helix-turn-helix domain-containing protein [Eubacteriales bacterium]|nr:helix-turn-helix domain-containing protein [Eubacteriales bacterium]
MNSLGEKLLKLRTFKKLTQDEVAEMLQINKQTYFRYENNHRVPNAETIKRLADVFETTADYLLGVEQENLKTKEHDEVMALREELRRRPEMKILFSASKKATKEDILSVAHLLERLKNSNGEF